MDTFLEEVLVNKKLPAVDTGIPNSQSTKKITGWAREDAFKRLRVWVGTKHQFVHISRVNMKKWVIILFNLLYRC